MENKQTPTSADTEGSECPADLAAELSDPQLQSAVEKYLEQLELGQAVDRNRYVAEYPAIAQQLDSCLRGLEFIHLRAPQLHADEVADVLPPLDIETTVATLGDFRLLREIGRGGMGVVYEAEQLSLGRTVAVKVLPFAAILDERHLQRFKTEARAAAAISHPHIVPVHFVGVERGVHFYAMQLIKGISLAILLKELCRQTLPEPPQLPDSQTRLLVEDTHKAIAAFVSTHANRRDGLFWRKVASLGIQAAEALECAHSHGVTHRDIKPANLLLDTDQHLWVTDFGLALLESEASVTITGDLVGTLRYMSPEQATGQTVDHKTDIYSLGTTLYELLTLHPVVDGTERESVLRQIARQEARPLRRFDPSIPVDLETIILKTLEKSPEDRYSSAQQLAEDLKRLLEAKPITARRASTWQRARKWSHRNRSLVMTAIVTLMATLLVSSAVLWRAQVRTQAALAESEHYRNRAEANLKVLTRLSNDLAMLGHRHPDETALREAIGIQEQIVNALGDDDSALPILVGMLQGYTHLAKLHLDAGQRDEARQACSFFWQLVARLDSLPAAAESLELEIGNQFRFVSALSRELGDRDGARRALLRSIRHFHRIVQAQPPHVDRTRAIAHLTTLVKMSMGQIAPHLDDSESIIQEYSASANFARQELQRLPIDSSSLEVAEYAGWLNMYLGDVLFWQGDLDAAVTRYRQAIDTFPPAVCLPKLEIVGQYYSIAENYESQGRLADAVALYRNAVTQGKICVEANPHDARLRKNLIIALSMVYHHGKLDESRIACAEMLQRIRQERELDPQFGEGETRSLLTSFVLRQTRGPFKELYDYEEALEWAERAVIDSDRCILMALATHRLGDDRSALQWLQNMDKQGHFDERDPVAFEEPLFSFRTCAALVHKRLGESEAAKKHYNKAVALFMTRKLPNNEERAFMLEAAQEFDDQLLIDRLSKGPMSSDNDGTL